MMKLTCFFSIFLLILLYSNSFAQYQMSLQNDTLVSTNQYEFDVFVKSTSGKINLTSYQIVFTFNETIANGGILMLNYISGSSQLSNVPNINAGIVEDIGEQRNLVAGSGHGGDTISVMNVKVGTFKITSSNAFDNFSPNIGWGFNGFIRTEVNINDTNKTNPSNHINLLTNSILPVELSSFTADLNNNSINLKWTTQTELNNYGFEIERGSVNIPFIKIGFIKGNGTTTVPHSYNFTDNNITGGTKFLYRLKQIDFDGHFKYSQELGVGITPKQYVLYQNYPNPFNPSTTITFYLPEAADVNLAVYNILGERVATLINEFLKAGSHSIIFNARDLASGIYICRYQTANFQQTKKILLLK